MFLQPAIKEAGMRLSYLSRLFFAATLAIPGAAALADPLYNVTVIGGLGSTATDINRYGDVVGSITSGGVTHAFAYTGGLYANLGTLGGLNSFANAINDDGLVVGGASTASGDSHAFVFSGGSLHDLGTLGGSGSVAWDINNHGVIVGSASAGTEPDPYYQQAFRYEGGSMTGLGTLPGGAGSDAYAINNKGLIGGASYQGEITLPEYPYYAVQFRGGMVDPIGAPVAGNSAIHALNDLGQAVGGIPASSFPHGSHAFLYEGGVITDLGALDPMVDDSGARDINELGQIVGYAAVTLTPDTYGYHGFLYDAGAGGMVDLNTLIDPASGWEITDASGINGAQQIAATACRGGMYGDCYAVRLDLVSAVPEPGSWAMLVLGLGALSLRRVRRPGAR
ncbi:PEP-CTERM sorting domain-containing protein [Massilia aerilata]|uniref:PEP-CTERM sorting domain-containing protein n=1 Tax=Massilia aerilata TaxID=453817 RepID=A0ABW0RZA9_9BURK